MAKGLVNQVSHQKTQKLRSHLKYTLASIQFLQLSEDDYEESVVADGWVCPDTVTGEVDHW